MMYLCLISPAEGKLNAPAESESEALIEER